MRDDTARWAPFSPVDHQVPSLPGLSIGRLGHMRQTMVSGPNLSGLAIRGLDARVGWPDTATGNNYILGLRRDRVMVVGDCDRQDGWDESAKVAVSDVSQGWAVYELTGPKVLGFLNRGTELDPSIASASVSRLFAGLGVMIYFHTTRDTARLHVGIAQEAAFREISLQICRAWHEHS